MRRANKSSPWRSVPRQAARFTQRCPVRGTWLKVKEFTARGLAPCCSLRLRLSGEMAALGGLSWRRLQMSEFIALCEARTLMTEALRVVNDVGEDASPELHAGLRRVRHHLDSAIQGVYRATDPDPTWPGFAARA
jgi:hypothetical protein